MVQRENPRKILIITGIFPPEIGGPANYTNNLSKKLLSLGYQVKVLTYANRGDEEIATDYEVVRVYRSGKLSNYFRFFLKCLSLASKADVVYSLDWFSAGFPLYLASFLLGKKYILRIGGGYMWEKYLAEDKSPVTLIDFYEKGLQSGYKIIFNITKIVLRGASYIIFNSETQRNLYIKFYSLNNDKTIAIKNPVDKQININTDATSEPQKVIVFAGRFIAMKNVDSAIKAFAKLEDKSFKFRIIGDGPKENQLRNLVADLGLGDRVTFEHSMLAKDLYESIKSCYYVIIPSWTDVSPNQVYECLSFGIPVLLTKENYLDTGLPKELMIDPNSVDDIESKMNMLLDTNKYGEFREEFFKIKQPETWEQVTNKHIEVFDKVYK